MLLQFLTSPQKEPGSILRKHKGIVLQLNKHQARASKFSCITTYELLQFLSHVYKKSESHININLHPKH